MIIRWNWKCCVILNRYKLFVFFLIAAMLIVIRLWYWAGLIPLLCIGRSDEQCSSDIPDSDKRDCYPWPGVTQTLCEIRGCVWNPKLSTGAPGCYYNDRVCPSLIPELSRVDCLPEGGLRSDCLGKGCIWCEPSSPGYPFCFFDQLVSLGGEKCRADIPTNERIDCHPEPNITRNRCLSRGCYWCDESLVDGAPKCFQPPEQGYRISGKVAETAQGFTAILDRVNTPSWYGSDLTTVRLDVEFQTSERLRIKFSDALLTRFEVPLNITSPPGRPAAMQYAVSINTDPVFSIQVRRKETNAVVFDTSIGGLILSDQFLQIVTRLNSENLYGFGEHMHPSLRHDMTWKSWAMYARDQLVVPSTNLYGTQPFYINLEKSGHAHGVLFLNSNAQEVKLMPAPAVTYRTIGGVLDIYMFFGPKLNSVVEQYTEAVGRPVMVPYWSLGFHLSRFGYRNLNHMQQAVDRMRQYNIPHDVQYADIDYMEYSRDFTINSSFGDLPSYVQQLKREGTRFITILDPAIYRLNTSGSYQPYVRGNQYDVWVKTSTGENAPGYLRTGDVYYADFSNPNTQKWWTQECVLFRRQLAFDGLWIDKNEPANIGSGYRGSGCDNNSINNPPYVPQSLKNASLYVRTLCPDAQSKFGMHYNTHSLYAWSMARPTLIAARAATGTRSLVFSRSTYPGSGKYAQHWLGDNWSTWESLKHSLIGVMEFNMFGYPYVGPDICGYKNEPTEELCLRWHLIGAFYTFSRNHNQLRTADQDPGIWPSVGNVAREALHIRYTLLPYLYTLLHDAHSRGTPVIRPLFFEFPADVNTHDVSSQFMWGSAIIFSPVLTKGAVTVDAYFPDARWFSYYDGSELPIRGATTTLSAPLNFIPIHIHGGHVIPTQKPANSTMFSRSLPMGLIVALDDTMSASGVLFWDDGESVDTFENDRYFLAEYAASSGQVKSKILHNGYSAISDLAMDVIKVMGLKSPITAVRVNGSPVSSWLQSPTTKMLTVHGLKLSLTTSFTVEWS